MIPVSIKRNRVMCEEPPAQLTQFHVWVYCKSTVQEKKNALHRMSDQSRVHWAFSRSEMFPFEIGSSLPSLHWWQQVLLRAGILTVEAQSLHFAIDAPLLALPRRFSIAMRKHELRTFSHAWPFWCLLSFLVHFNFSSNYLIILVFWLSCHFWLFIWEYIFSTS